MLKKAEYDEENSYRAIKTCLTRNTNSSSTAAAAAAVAVASSSFVSSAATSVGSSNSAAGSFGYHTNHRSSGSHRHKQGGSLQDLVEATHRSELATTSSQVAVAAAVAAAAVANHCFNCDYQLSGGRNSMNRRQHQQQQHNQNSSSINSQLPNSLSTASSSSSASKRINKNSTVSARQREGGSLPSSVNQFESAVIMDPAKLKHILGSSSSGGVGGEVTPTTSTSAGTGSCLSLPETEAATQFDMDDEAIMDSGSATSTQQDSFMNRWDISADTKLWNIANGPDLETLEELREIRKTKKVNPASAAGSSFNTHSMTLLGAKILEGLQQQKQQQQQQQQQQYPAVPANVSGGAAPCVPYPQTADDQKLRLDTGYVSLNDNYTACSSVYGVSTTDGDSNKTGSSGGASSSFTSSTTTTVNGGGGVAPGTAPKGAVEDIRASKIGRMLSGGSAAAAAKSGSQRQFDENGNALSDGYGGGAGSGTGNGVAASTNGNSNQFTALITTTVAAAHPPSSSSTQRQNSVSTLLSTGTNTTTTAMAAAAVAASINSQLGGAVPTQTSGTANINATNTTITTTKLKSKKKSQQERNTIQYLVDTQTIAGCRGADPVEQLLKYIENDEKNNSAGQKKKERKKQSKLKKSNSLEELRSCSKMEVDDLNKYQAATTDMMRQKKTGSGSTASGPSATDASKHNSSSVADINKNCNKEQQGVQPQQQQTVVASATVQVRAQPRKSERRSWGTEELQYLGDQQQKEQQTQMDWPSPLPKMSTLEFPALAGMSEMDALNTVLSETAEFHVVTKKKKPKKQRAVTMDDATVGAAHHTGGNLQRMQPITKSASSNMMSHRVQQQQHYANHYGNQQLPPPHSKMERQFVEKHQSTSTGSSHISAGSVHAHGQGSQSTSTTSNSSGHQDSSRRKSTSSMPPSEKSDSSDLDSVHSLPIQTGKKKSSRVNSGSSSSSSSTSAQAAGQRQSKQNNNNYNSPPAAISYADIARKRLEAALNSGGGTTSNSESSPPDLFNSGSGVGGGSGKSSSTKQAKTKPDFPELPGAAANTLNLTTGLPTPAGIGMGTTGGGPAAAAATHIPPSSTSVTSSASISSLQKSKSVENEVSYSFNSTNLDQQYPALEMTVKRHSTTNVAMASSSINNNTTTKQQAADKSTSAKLKAKPKEKTSSMNHSSSKPTTLKTTAATQTDRTKKISGKFGGAAVAGSGSGGTASGGLAGSSSITPSGGSSSVAGRPAVIILNDRDDRDATHNEFIFGDFNEDELKMFNDHENTEESSNSNQENTRNKLIRGGEEQSDVVAADEDEDETESKEHSAKLGKESSTDLSSDQLVLNDSGAASDAVNMSSTLDMLSISVEAVQSSPNAANAAAITNNNSSTLSSNTSNSSSSASISSSASARGAGGDRTIAGGASGGGGGISSLANQSNDSGIIANTSVNNFISKASSSDVLVSMQQLETCNDIEAAIIAAARAAAAAAKRSTSCSRSNSQEPGEFLLPAKTVNKSSATANKTTLPVYMAYQDGDDDDETLHELSFMPDLNKMELGAATATSLPDEEHLPPPPVALARQSGVLNNTDLIVDYIASTWNAIVKSKYVTFYSEEPEPES
ncbi:uncharacterized protein Dwil_GK15592 [Drosophila willistoni]|uniref:Uncharacterized protein n=1 Tax=Drosophila willistoni TaxID=7260 RepID=B4NPA8_DROWI|nr:uncharacterized protein Dwil_GK15592 [Drosophila willistoni]